MQLKNIILSKKFNFLHFFTILLLVCFLNYFFNIITLKDKSLYISQFLVFSVGISVIISGFIQFILSKIFKVSDSKLITFLFVGLLTLGYSVLIHFMIKV